MNGFELIKPGILHIGDLQSFRQEMLDANSSMDGTGPLKRMADITQWLEFNQRLENEETVPDNFVAGEQFIYIRKSDNKIVGMINFRHYFNDYLEKYGGHIGYSVRPSERRKGYAKNMLADCLKICKAHGLARVLITCIPENEGSKRTILANNGIYESTVYCESEDVRLNRYWINF